MGRCQGSLRRFYRGPRKAPLYRRVPHLFLTHTNLRGVPYEIGFKDFNDDKSGYAMKTHADRVHYKVAGVGCATVRCSEWAKDDPAKNLISPN